jgi:hypothetical protein
MIVSYQIMLHALYSLLHWDSYNWYWFGALWLTVVTSGLSVIFSHAQQFRQHRGMRLVSDLLVREQLGFLSFAFALFISAYIQADQKVLGPWFAILGVLGVGLYGLGLWLTATCLHGNNEKCEQDPMKPCTKPVKSSAGLLVLGLPFLFFIGSFALACFLVFAVSEQRSTKLAVGKLVPVNVSISSVPVGAGAFRDTPSFVRDNLAKLEDEQREANPPDHVVGVIESESLAGYGQFCWNVALAQDYQADFALSARAAYLTHADSQRSFVELSLSEIGKPYYSIVVQVPESSVGDRIVIVSSIYARVQGKPVLRDIMRMLTTEVNCP